MNLDEKIESLGAWYPIDHLGIFSALDMEEENPKARVEFQDKAGEKVLTDEFVETYLESNNDTNFIAVVNDGVLFIRAIIDTKSTPNKVQETLEIILWTKK